MKIMLNGSPEDITPCSILDFITGKGLSADGVVVEYNYRIVKKNEWHDIQLQEDDNLEVLSFVGGG